MLVKLRAALHRFFICALIGYTQPNNSFKPNLLRYSKSVAEKASHAFASSTQVGLTQVLDGMSTMQEIVQFKSERFKPLLPEECQVNPDVYGAELAFWLGAELASRGIATSYPEAEDWGWFLSFSTENGSEFAIHCVNVDGAMDLWSLSLRRYPRKMFGRDKPPYSDASSLVAAIRDSVQSIVPSTDAQWQYETVDAV